MPQAYGVTGVASGIGAKLAEKLKGRGHQVVGYDLREPDQELDFYVPLDLSSQASLVEASASTPIKLDGLCNNAGLPPRDGMEEAILQVNFLGTRAFTSHMLPHMKAGASLVNMASRAGHGWRDNLPQVKAFAALSDKDQLADFIADQGINATRAYNLSKEAVILWTMAMAEDMVQRDLRINCLSPGGIATGILDDFRRAFGDQMAKNVARAGRPGTPEEVAEVAAFVLSPESHWLKGADIAIDGGMGAFNMSDALGLEVMKQPI